MNLLLKLFMDDEYLENKMEMGILGGVQCSVNGQINLHNYLTMHTSIYCMSYLSL